MARQAETTKNSNARKRQAKASGKAAAKRDAKNAGAKLRANASAKPAPVEADPLMTTSVARDIAGVAIAVFAVASFIAVVSPASAPLTLALSNFFHQGFGLGAYVLPLGILALAARVFVRDRMPLDVRTVAGAVLLFVTVLAMLVLAMTPDTLYWGVTVTVQDLVVSGGYVGYAIASVLAGALGKTISMVVLVGVLLAALVLIGFSVSDVIGRAAAGAAKLAERRHVDVNEHPWGDAEAVTPADAARPAHKARPQQASLFNADDAAPTTFLGNRETSVLDDADDEADENPFVDVSERVTSDAAPTTLIPIEETFSAAADAELGDERGATVSLPADQARTTLLPHNEGDTEARTKKTASDAAVADHVAEPPIPAFLQHPHAGGAASVDGSSVGGVSHAVAAAAAVEKEAAAARTNAASAAPARVSRPSEEKGEEDAERPLPPASMLRHNPHSATSASSNKELEQTASSLQSTLAEFNLHSKVVGWISGPTVTTFKVQPGEGERVSRISSLEDDIALSLAAQSVRIFAPIPNTSLVGIEIPNRKRQNVNLGDVLPYVQGGPLELAIGRDAEGAPIVADLAKMPHLLIAGTTGSGKSVMINSIVMSLLMRTHPDDVRLIMVDPKRVELAGYNGLPHLYVPVVTEPKQAASALQWAVSEMERRLKVFERVGVRKISTFNEKQAAGVFEQYDNPPAKMPYLVIIIDELSDLMMVAGKDVEASIVRIAQLGRAAGIHLIVATQRPSSNVVTGLIKANITNRIAFNVATGIDSRVIIDQVGAEKLTGYGDMLFSKVDWGKPKRIQGCFVSDDEINQVVEFVKSHGEPDYHEEILSAVAPATMAGGGGGHEASDDDPLMWEAAHIVVESQLGSTSGLQRRLKVGYARAGRIMDMLEEKGVVGPPDGSKPREVLLDEEGLAALEAVEAQLSADDVMGGF